MKCILSVNIIKGGVFMPGTFLPSTSTQYIKFDFDGLLKSCESLFGNLSFFDTWKNYWLNVFLEQDEAIKEYMKKFPDTNPIVQRMKLIPKQNQPLDGYELYTFEHVTDYGTFYFHFDIAAMNYLKHHQHIPVQEIDLSDIYIDPDTIFLEDKIHDQRFPYFVRMYGTEKPYLCVDGNKRITSRIKQGHKKFQGYVFTPEHIQNVFFGSFEVFYYVFLYECDLMYRTIQETSDENEVLRCTQLYLQANFNG